jgi:hypothetical protein
MLTEANFFSVVPKAPILVYQFLTVKLVYSWYCIGPGLLFPENKISFLFEQNAAVFARLGKLLF